MKDYRASTNRESGKATLTIVLVVSCLIIGAIVGGEIIRRMYTGTFLPYQPSQNADSMGASQDQPQQQRIDDVGLSRNNSIVRATSKAAPSVVGIVVTQLQVVNKSYSSDDFFDFFFGPEQAPKVREVERMGSGFIFSKEGRILTNYHVVEGAQKLFVTLANGTQLEGKIIGVDPQTDLAVISVDAPNLPCSKLGDSDKLMIGEWAIAIGNPFGFFINDARPTVTVGVISAVDRNFAPSEGVYYQGMIQTDAAINQGNSGGPLVNALGEVIGINAFIFTGSDNYRGSIGMGFAIPVERAKRVVKELLTFGKRRMIYTGISVQDLTHSVAAALGYGKNEGVVISDIAHGSTGEAAKLLRGDIIIQMGNRTIYSSKDIGGFFLDYFVGDTVTITFIRKSKRMETTIVLGQYKGQP